MAKVKTLPLLKNPDKKLRKVSQSVLLERVNSDELKDLIARLKETMKKENGVGIAAPQVGLHERVIIVDKNGQPTAFINPEIIETSFKLVDSEEGCLSVPGYWGIVKRHRSVRVRAIDEQGKSAELKANGLLAIIFQHEIDHLNGVLFIDRAEELYETNGKQLAV